MAANSLTLSWSASTGSTPITYQPMFRVTGAATFIPFGQPTAALTVVVTGLVASTSYDFDIVATNPFGSATSVIVTDATNSGNAFPTPNAVAGSQNTGSALPVLTGPQNGAVFTTIPLAVAGITIADSAASGAVTLKVTCSSGTLGMTVAGSAVAGSGSASITYSGTLANCQAAVGSLVYTAPASPTVDTVAVSFTDQTAASNTLLIQLQVTTQVAATAPNAPTGLTAGTPTNVSMQLNWSASTVGTAPITYQAMVRVHNTPPFVAFGAATNGLTVTASGLTPATSYDFQVVASNSAGNATSASIVASTTNALVAPSAPTNLQVTGNTSTSLTFSWTASGVGSAPLIYQPQFRVSGAASLTNWYENPGQDGGWWKQPFASSANWISSGPLITALRGGKPSVNLKDNFSVPFYIGKATDPLVTVTDGTKSISVHIPLGAVIETPVSQFDQSIGGSDSTQPYLVWSISGATMTVNGNPATAVAAAGTVITGTYGFAICDGTGQFMCDAVTGQPGDGNAFGIIQDIELAQIQASTTYVIPHMLTMQLDPSFQASQGGPIWPLKLLDTSPSPASYLGPIPQGVTIGIPASIPRPTGKSRGYYALWDQLQQQGMFNYNFGGTGGVNFMIYSASGAYASLVADIVASWPAVAAQLCILDYTSGVSGAQYSLATAKGAISGSVPAFPPPPVLDLSPTGGHTVAPSTFGAWYPSGYNVTPPFTAPVGTGPFIQFQPDPWTRDFSSDYGPAALATTSVTITGLAPNTSYDLEVVALNAAGQATSAIITSKTGLPSGIPTDTTGTQAKPAQDLLNRFGINTHFGNGLYAAFTPAQAITAIQSIGCTLVRDSDNG